MTYRHLSKSSNCHLHSQPSVLDAVLDTLGSQPPFAAFAHQKNWLMARASAFFMLNNLVCTCSECPVSADCVEKLRILDAAIFRKEPLMPKSQMRSVMRRSELAHERQKTNLAEPLVSKSWLRCTDKNFADFAKNGVFQHNPPILLKNSLLHLQISKE